MSLIETEKQICCRVVMASVPDGHGAQITRYVDTRTFKAILTPTDSSAGTKSVGGETVSAKKYKLFYPNDVKLELDDIIKTKADGKTYKITADENKAANASSIQYNLAFAEEWSVPDE